MKLARFRRALAVAALAAALGAWTLARGAQETAVVITYVRGPVEVLPGGGGASRPAQLGMKLAVGDTLHTAAQGEATLLFPGGGIVKVAPNNQLLVGRTAPQQQSLTTRLIASVSSLFFPSPEEDQLTAWGGIRKLTADFQILEPRNTSLLTPTPVLTWTRLDEPGTQYQVTILRSQGKVERRTAAARLDFAQEGLQMQPGELYFIIVDAVAPNGTTYQDKAYLKLLEAEKQQAVAESLQEVKRLEQQSQEDTTPQLLRANLYLQSELYSDASAVFANLRQRYPSERYPLEQLILVKRKVGLDDEARLLAAELQKME